MTALQQALDFTDRDLALNRRGRLSHRQAVRLGHGRPRLRRAMLGIALLCGGAGLGLFLYGLDQVAYTALAVAAGVWYLHARVDRRRGPVRPILGPVDVYAVPTPGEDPPRAHVCVGGLDVPVSVEALRAFAGRSYCRVHVAPDHRDRLRIVSAEPADAPPADAPPLELPEEDAHRRPAADGAASV
jgi:hypothetical protein